MQGVEAAFSRRTNWDLAESDWARALRERRAAGLPVFDLTASNPTRCGMTYAPALLDPLRDLDALVYDPAPLGTRQAREAVSAYYRAHGADVAPEQMVLTTSTSEAYSFLFRLLCDPGDEVLIAQPSYPLFDFLAQLDNVRLAGFALFYDHGWHLDAAALRARITPTTRAIVVVHPNNPTGHFVKPRERSELETICAEYGLALIVDEVFLDYPLGDSAVPSFTAGDHAALTFVLSGLSKVAALPQMKAGWIAACGPQSAEAMARLEVIADTFLSMNAPIQCALPQWLAGRAEIQQQIRRRTAENLAALDHALAAQTLVSRLTVEAGWYAVLRVPAVRNDEELALTLLDTHGVAIHPGNYFGFSGDGRLVASLLAPTEEFAAGVKCLVEYFRG